jgi:hypothetical protein
MNLRSRFVLHSFLFTTWIIGVYVIYRWSVARASPEVASSRADWFGIAGEGLSLLILLEATQVIARTALHRSRARATPGVVYLWLCACYMCSYAILGGFGAGLSWQMGDILRAAGMNLPGAVLYDLKVRWSDDWAQLGYLAIPAVVATRALPFAPNSGTAVGSSALDLLGRFLLVVMPILAVAHEVYRPWALH